MADAKSRLSEERLTELRQLIQQMRLIDDVFFEKVMEDRETCEEVIRVIMEDPKLVVKEVHLQEPIHNLQGRSVRLDALCEKADGNYINVEVQRASDDNHFKRVRYNASCITANITDPGEKFKNVKDVCVIYISEFDIFKRGKTIYHTRQIVRETEADAEPAYVEDGFSSVYVNTEVDDQTLIAELMQCFLQAEVRNQKFPKLTERVMLFKESEEGVLNMNSAWREFTEKVKEEGRAEGRAAEIIRLSRKYHISDVDIRTDLQMTLQISPEDAEKYMEMFAK